MLSLNRVWNEVENLALLLERLSATGGGGGGGGGSLTFVALAAGGTYTITPGLSVFILIDGTGAANTVNLAGGTEGQVVVGSIVSSAPGSSPSIPNLEILPGSGNQISELTGGNVGALLAAGSSQTVTTQGFFFGLRYRASVTAPATAPAWIRER